MEEKQYETLLSIFVKDILGNWYEKLGMEIYKIDDIKFVNDFKYIHEKTEKSKGRMMRSLAISCTSTSSMVPYIENLESFEYIGQQHLSKIYQVEVSGVSVRIDHNTDGVHVELEEGLTPQQALDVIITLIRSSSLKTIRNEKLNHTIDG
jgi:hypothetical protein